MVGIQAISYFFLLQSSSQRRQTKDTPATEPKYQFQILLRWQNFILKWFKDLQAGK